MSCNHCATSSTVAAIKAGAPEIEAAFRDGQDFSYQLSGDKRTRSVDVHRQPDGSSNGDNYLLLNPFTASLKTID